MHLSCILSETCLKIVNLYFKFIALTIIITERKIKFQDQTKILNSKMQEHCLESLQRLETVKYYCAEEYEIQSYKQSVIIYQVNSVFLEISYLFSVDLYV